MADPNFSINKNVDFFCISFEENYTSEFLNRIIFILYTVYMYIIHSTENIDPIVKDYKPDNIYTFILRW